ncbi:hypothetical protein BDE27_1685 [Xenorhabdus ehlersii]|uniref:Uncharacterized protein n=1 Tax=Xenorhabdus ehlersii TaxID=290111 RepID=A0A2D0ILD7_9GAMM|nr:hypothetical protein Xehl_03596 [Xenorhabdus ehlersii]RKE91459.1 hypothetical protein BDE27_1685 [Xenorhabdus ehlersii]
MKKSLAVKRHHMYRLKVKRGRYNNAGGQPDKTSAEICYRTPCLCSCWMCANHRDVFGMSIKEIRDRAKYTDYPQVTDGFK